MDQSQYRRCPTCSRYVNSLNDFVWCHRRDECVTNALHAEGAVQPLPGTIFDSEERYLEALMQTVHGLNDSSPAVDAAVSSAPETVSEGFSSEPVAAQPELAKEPSHEDSQAPAAAVHTGDLSTDTPTTEPAPAQDEHSLETPAASAVGGEAQVAEPQA